jgi:glycosyltransferase involved in cell wall biosynthesis
MRESVQVHESVQEFVVQVNSLIDHGRLGDAQEILEEALFHHPDNLLLLELLDKTTLVPNKPFIVPKKLSNPQPNSLSKSPLVSVTVCTYNHSKFIRECILSVLAQSYSPLEIIIGDDASSDGTSDIIKQCLKQYDGPHQIKLYEHKKNLGGSGRGNFLHTLRRTRGEFIVQFCGDDVMYPRMIEKMVKTWQDDNLSIVTINADLIDSDSNSLARTWRPIDVAPNDSFDNLVRDGVNDCVFGAGMGCDRRLYEAFPPCSGSPPNHLQTQDIMLCFYGGLLNGCKYITEPLMQYRIHGDQNSLSIAIDRAASELNKLVLEEKMWFSHLAHSHFMSEVMDRCVQIAKDHYQLISDRIKPLLSHQSYLMSSRLIAVRKRLHYEFGLDKFS